VNDCSVIKEKGRGRVVLMALKGIIKENEKLSTANQYRLKEFLAKL
jgi:hypothetical protein